MFGIHYIGLRLWITAERRENISTRRHQINLSMLKRCGDNAAIMTAVTTLLHKMHSVYPCTFINPGHDAISSTEEKGRSIFLTGSGNTRGGAVKLSKSALCQYSVNLAMK